MRRTVLIVAGFLVTLPAVSLANGWAVFEDRCLAPMEHFMPGIAEGLAPHAGADAARYVAELVNAPTLSFETGVAGVILHLSEGPVCTVSVSAGETRAREAALSWQAAALRSGRYVETPDGALESNLWREPRLAVQIVVDAPGGRAVFTALETDLES